MYSPSFADLVPDPPPEPATVEGRIAAILALRQQLVTSRDLLYLPPPARQLIEREIPALIRLLQGGSPP